MHFSTTTIISNVLHLTDFLCLLVTYCACGMMVDQLPIMKTLLDNIRKNSRSNNTNLLISSKLLPSHYDLMCEKILHNDRSANTNIMIHPLTEHQTGRCHMCSDGCKYENKTYTNNACHSIVFSNISSTGYDFEVQIYHDTHVEELVVNKIMDVCWNQINCSKLREWSNMSCTMKEQEKHRKPIWPMVEDISLLLSLLCLLFTIFFHLAIPELRNLHGKNISCFSFSLFISQLFMFHDFGIKGNTPCIGVAVMLQYFWLVVFAWTSVLSFDIARTFHASNLLRQRREQKHGRRFGIYSLVAWGTPLVLVSISYFVTYNVFESQTAYSHGVNCFLAFNVAIYAIGIPFTLSTLFNIVCFGVIIYGLESHRRKSTIATSTSTQKRGDRFRCFIYAKLSVLCGLAWVLFFLVHNFGDGFRHVAAIILNFQGILIFLSTVLLNRRAIGALKRRINTKKTMEGNNQTELSTICQQHEQHK